MRNQPGVVHNDPFNDLVNVTAGPWTQSGLPAYVSGANLVNDGGSNTDIYGDRSRGTFNGPGDDGSSGSGRRRSSGSANPAPNPAPTTPSPTPPKDITDRLADILEKMFGQEIAIPASGQPTVVPQPTTTSSIIPILLIIAGIAVVGYMLYKKKGG